MSVGTACGKAILFGEHAVVYGVPAIAAGLAEGATARAEAAADVSSLRIEDLLVTSGQDHDLARALDAVLATLEVRRPLDLVAETTLPKGAGLGCSAALGVAVARAAAAFGEGSVADAAHAWESVFHGNPSGVDTTVAAIGGCIRFVRGEGPKPIHLAAPLHLAIGHSGSPSATKGMVAAVARQRERKPDMVQKTFDAIRSVVENGKLALEAGDLRAVGQLLDLNHMLLSGLMLSTPELEDLLTVARDEGSLGGKLTGAGGGGCAIALAADGPGATRIVEAWRARGRWALVAEVRP